MYLAAFDENFLRSAIQDESVHRLDLSGNNGSPKAPTGYLLDETPKNIVVRTGVANSLIFDNQPGTTLIIKKAAILVRDQENRARQRILLRILFQNRQGAIPFVPEGETLYLAAFVIDQTTQIQTITVNPADTQTLVVYNEPLCSLTLTKRDPVPGTALLV